MSRTDMRQPGDPPPRGRRREHRLPLHADAVGSAGPSVDRSRAPDFRSRRRSRRLSREAAAAHECVHRPARDHRHFLLAPCCLVLLVLAAGCPGGGDGTSPAADEYIAAAETEEERQALVEARDEIDEEMAALAAEKDAEIERLRKENEELRRELEERSR